MVLISGRDFNSRDGMSSVSSKPEIWSKISEPEHWYIIYLYHIGTSIVSMLIGLWAFAIIQKNTIKTRTLLDEMNENTFIKRIMYNYSEDRRV